MKSTNNPTTQSTSPDDSVSSTDIDLTQDACPRAYAVRVRNAFAVDPESRDGSVSNVNISSSVGVELDITAIIEDFEWALAGGKPETANGFCKFTFEFDSGDATGRLTPNGTVIITGRITPNRIIATVERVHHELRNAGLETVWNPVDVTNVVVTFDKLDSSINRVDLYAISLALGDAAEFDPDLFSGLMYEPPGTDLKCMVFSTGTVNVVGAESTEQAVKQRDVLYNRLEQYGLIPE